MRRHALAFSTFLLVVAFPAWSARAGDLGVSISQEGCGDLDLGEVERIIGIEIEGMVEAEERTGELGLRIVCKTDGVHIKATEAETGHDLERTTPALDENEEQPERVIALAASQLLLASWREMQDLREARETLEELRELYVKGEISADELRRRQEQIGAIYLGEGELADDPCAKVTCSFHGGCVLEDGEPVCECDDDFAAVQSRGPDCIPDVPGWSREAAITGLVSGAFLGVTGGIAPWMRAVSGGPLVLINAGLIAVMGPVVGSGAHRARQHPDVGGNPFALVAASSLYGLSLVGSVLDIVLFDPAMPWFTATWAGLGAVSMLLFAVDALAVYEQALTARDGVPPTVDEDGWRVWTWFAFGMAGTAAVSAGIVGGLALQERKDLNEPCFDDLWSSVDTMPSGCNGEQYEGFQASAGAAFFLIEVAAVATVLGITLYFLEPRLSSEPAIENVSVVPYAVPGGVGFALGGRF